MLILLPPSEGKATAGRGRPMDLARLSFPGLGPAREGVVAALAAASARDDALQLLGVGPAVADEVAGNAQLGTAPALRVRDLYTGVLYDALDLASLDAAANRRANARLVVVSALYGALRPSDRVAPYRLAMHVELPGVGPLARFWAPQLAQVLPAAAGTGIVVDCRSTSYRSAWRPPAELAERWVLVEVPGASHGAKHTRGLVARRLCQVPAPRRVGDLPAALGEQFTTELVVPPRPGRPWTVRVHASH